MSLDLDRLENPRHRGGKLIARCPACAELGADKSGEHLFVADAGRGAFGCIAFAGPDGDAHRKRIWELVGDASSKPRLVPVSRPTPAPKPTPRIPPLRKLTVEEMAGIAHLRGWTYFAGLQLLTNRGLLWHGEVFDAGTNWPAWIITDATRRNAQARRLDGQPWQGIGSAKAKTLPGSDPSWPIGAADIGERPLVLLCEGGPDFCAALLLAWWEGQDVQTVAPVSMTGAGNSIHPDALPLFAGKHVRIAVHADTSGRDAGERWARQLYQAGASLVDGFHFDGLTMADSQPVNDLADLATLLDTETQPETQLFAGMASCPLLINQNDVS